MEKLLKNALALFDKRSTLMVQADGNRYALLGQRELDRGRLLYARWKVGEAQGPVVEVDTSLFKEAIKRDAQVSLNGRVWVGEVGLECQETTFEMPRIEPQVWVNRKELIGSLEAVTKPPAPTPAGPSFEGPSSSSAPPA
jgi:hypothetical protein